MNELIAKAFLEDMPSGDITTEGLGKKELYGFAQIKAKQDLILSGRRLFTESVLHLEPEAKLHWQFKDGDSVLSGQIIGQVEGNLLQILKAERVALNFLGYLSGVATQTAAYVKECNGTQCKILDTRKTLPLYRHYLRQAVRDGGGHNHRLNLSDAILIKENHIVVAGSITEAVQTIRKQHSGPIEVEVTNAKEVAEAVGLKVERLLLDNMTEDQMRTALKLIPPGIETEASGNMTLERIAKVAVLGVDFISVGALTHSVKTADISLLFDWPK